MKTRQFEGLKRYVSNGRNRVTGWFAYVDAEIFRTLLVAQATVLNVHGGCAEIGVHQGKSFVALCLGLRPSERAYCIDVFANQDLNRDASGKGNRPILENNLAKWGGSESSWIIRQGSSTDVAPGEIKNAVGPVRFFSVDGGHWLEIVANDLALAEATLSEGGIIALDDFHRLEWPDVSAGYFTWYASRKKDLVPFALGFNKLYLCERSWLSTYQSALAENRTLNYFVTKRSTFQGIELPVYSEYLLPEFGFVFCLMSSIRIFYPGLFVRIQALKEGARSTAKKMLGRH